MNLKLLTGTILLTLGIVACSCSGSSPTPGGSLSTPTPVATPTSSPTTAPSTVTTADVTFVVPTAASVRVVQSNTRAPRYVSPGTTNFSLAADGTVVIPQASVFANGNYTGPNGATYAVTSTAQSSGQQVTVHITTTPGTHTYGIVTTDNASKPDVLAEGQQTWTLTPGSPTSNNRALVLAGVAATTYILCPTAAENADASHTCSNYENFSDGRFHLVAVAGDAVGFPIYFQSGVNFDNGQVSVVETTSGGNILTIQNGGPYSDPGSALTTNGVSAGNAFTAICTKLGTATLALSGTNGQGTVTGIDYSKFTLPPANSILPHGPATIAGVATPPNPTIRCIASMVLTLI